MKIERVNIGENGRRAHGVYPEKRARNQKRGSARRRARSAGGGYEFVSNPENEPVALEYSAKGFQAFTLEYSVGEKGVFPAPQLEVTAALAAIRANAENWFVDVDKIALVGFPRADTSPPAWAFIGLCWRKRRACARNGEAERPRFDLSLHHGGGIFLPRHKDGARKGTGRRNAETAQSRKLRRSAHAARLFMPLGGRYLRAGDEYAAFRGGAGEKQRSL